MTRFWSKKIVRVLEAYAGSGRWLVGATGDIDSLGLYVAEHGRAKAENLVDIVNHIVGNELLTFFERHTKAFPSYCLLPSGEEMLILAVCCEPSAYQNLRHVLDCMTDIIHRDSPMDARKIGITFGSKRFKKTFGLKPIKQLIRSVYRSEAMKANARYLDVLYQLRLELALELDKGKFHSLGSHVPPILCRNLVYQETIEYKRRTQRILKEAASRVAQSRTLRSRSENSEASRRYGLKHNDLSLLKKLKG